MCRLSLLVLITILGLIVLEVIDGKDYNYNSDAFKFVGGFLGFDGERTARTSKKTPGLHIIGAGFSRTGTKSMEAALLHLGHKIYDTRSMLELKHADQWVEAAIHINEAGNSSLAEHLLNDIESQGYTATLDFPINLFAKTFADLRPDAKVIFTTRDTDAWFQSWHNVNVVLSVFVLRPWTWLVDFTFAGQISQAFNHTYIYPSFPDHIHRPLPWFEICHSFPSFDAHDSKHNWILLYEHTRQQLEESLPASRFIAFDVRQGWAPLLDFLQIHDTNLADKPLPHVNDIESLRMVRRVMDIVAISLPLWIVLSVTLSSFLLWYLLAKVACHLRGSIIKPKCA